MADEETKKAQKENWNQLLIGIGAGIAIALLSLTNFYQDLESSSYDFRFLKRNDWVGQPTQLPFIATIDIDDAATQAHGFPFKRNLHADLVDVISQFGARVIGFDIFFYEPAGQTLSLADIDQLDGDLVSKTNLMGLARDHDAEFSRVASRTNIVFSAQTFELAEDKSLAFVQRNLRDRSPAKSETIATLERFSKPVAESIAERFYLATDIDVPLRSYIETSRGVGFALPKPDHDGIVRRYRLALYYDGRVYFSLGLAMACDYVKVPLERVQFADQAIVLPGATLPDGSRTDLRIPTSGKYEMLVNWAGPFKQTFRHFPYNLVIEFAEFEPQIRALNFGKRLYHESPDLFMDDDAYVRKAMEVGLTDLSPELLLQYRNVVMDCAGIEETLLDSPDLTVETFLTSVGVPDEDMQAVVDVFAPFFDEVKTNLRIARILEDDADAPLAGIAEKLGTGLRIKDIDHSVGVLRHIIKAGGIRDEHRPLFFLDRVKTEGLHAESADARILTEDEFSGGVFFYGLTATGSHDLNPTPFGAREAMLGAHVNVYNTILTRNFLTRLEVWQNAAIMVILGIVIGVLVPRFKAVSGATVVLILLTVYILTAIICFIYAGLWIDILGPVATLAVGYLSITLYDYVQKEKEKDFVQGAFGHYLDPKVVDQLVENPNLVTQLGGDQRVMTVFFSDIASFSTISENVTAVELVELLNEYLTEMCDVVALHDGTIDKFEGDAIMAFWGAPVPMHDHAQAAVFACIEMQQKCAELRERFEREGRMVELRQWWKENNRGQFFRVRMGINTGEMVVGNLGSKTRVDYTVMGDAVNLASRLEGAGKAYGITSMISEETLRAAGDVCEVRPLDSFRVVGKDEPVRVYEVLGRKGEVSRKMLDVVDAFQEGYRMYAEQKWDEAIAHFESGLKIDSDDGPCNVFIERCAKLKLTPPPEPWDAIYNLEGK